MSSLSINKDGRTLLFEFSVDLPEKDVKLIVSKLLMYASASSFGEDDSQYIPFYPYITLSNSTQVQCCVLRQTFDAQMDELLGCDERFYVAGLKDAYGVPLRYN